jgi:hypothetical protein
MKLFNISAMPIAIGVLALTFLESIVNRARLQDCIVSLADTNTATDNSLTTALAFYLANVWLHRNDNLVTA